MLKKLSDMMHTAQVEFSKASAAKNAAEQFEVVFHNALADRQETLSTVEKLTKMLVLASKNVGEAKTSRQLCRYLETLLDTAEDAKFLADDGFYFDDGCCTKK
ncbi:MAG: hypothetical protein WC444_04925 [Candidatus Paceibacterota bacterium]